MKFIEDVLKKSYQLKYKSIITLSFALLFLFEIWLLEALSVKDFLAFIIVVLNILFYIILRRIVLSTLSNRFNFYKTKMYDEIKKSGYLNEFINTIDIEINSPRTIKYYNDIRKVGLLITETWFLLISSRNPKIRKTNEIYKIGEHVNTHSRIHCSIQFKDNSCVNEYIEYDEIKKELKEKYPNIYLE